MGKTPQRERLLTEVELEIMNVVWRLGTCTIKEVQEALPSARSLAYTSVATFIKILEKKKILKAHKGERVHTYSPLLTREAYESRSLKHMTEKVFQGSPSSLVMRLVDDADLTQSELESIRKLLEERMRS